MIVNPRDERGWMIPRPGTKRRQIYDALVRGERPYKIMRDMGFGSRKTFDDHRYFIVHTEKANANSYASKHR